MEEVPPQIGPKMCRCLRLEADMQSHFHTLPTDIIGITLNYLDIPNQARIYLPSGNSGLEAIWKQYLMTRISYGPGISLDDSINLLFVASEYGHLELVKNLLNTQPTLYSYITSYYPTTPFHTAVKYRHRHLVAFFLDREVNVNINDSTGLTALHYAVENGDLKMTNLLLNRNADPHLIPNIPTRKFNGDDLKPTCLTPIGWAIRHNQYEIVRLFHSRNMDLTAYCGNYIIPEDKYANRWLPPLHYATISGSVQMVKVLLECNLSPNGRWYGFTSLHFLVQYGLNRLNRSKKQMSSMIPEYIEKIKLLIHHGADITRWTSDGEQPIDLLIKKKRMDPRIYELLTPRTP